MSGSMPGTRPLSPGARDHKTRRNACKVTMNALSANSAFVIRGVSWLKHCALSLVSLAVQL